MVRISIWMIGSTSNRATKFINGYSLMREFEGESGEESWSKIYPAYSDMENVVLRNALACSTFIAPVPITPMPPAFDTAAASREYRIRRTLSYGLFSLQNISGRT